MLTGCFGASGIDVRATVIAWGAQHTDETQMSSRLCCRGVTVKEGVFLPKWLFTAIPRGRPFEIWELAFAVMQWFSSSCDSLL